MSLPFDTQVILSGLKDFQRDTVDYVFRRMYLDDDQTHRFLVADEVGLGKTLVARGIIARTVEHLWENTERIDVIYICSNTDIARQNINRLNVTNTQDFVLSSRITMLPTQLRDLAQNKLNFVSFTPGTSFNLHSTLGVKSERVLLYWLLDQVWDISSWGTGPKNVLRGYAAAERFRTGLKEFDTSTIDAALAQEFKKTLQASVQKARQTGREDLRSLFEDLSSRYQYKRMDHRIPEADKQDRARLVGALRAMLAQTCLKALEPDLVILDEFQRFKHLLGGEDEASQLARDLFTYTDEHTKVRVLLLSATPYKMYTLSHESDEDHYKDFIDTLRFLHHDSDRTEAFREELDAYRRELLRLTNRGVDRLLDLRAAIESELRHFMVRTERLADSPDRNGMLVQVPIDTARLKVQDIEAYTTLHKIAELVDQHDPIEYWKSSPYLLNFMDDYKLKKQFESSLAQPQSSMVLIQTLKLANKPLLLSWIDIAAYVKVDPGNARLRYLMNTTIEQDLWRLLWLPPSLPYYQLAFPFKDNVNVTKRLVFSSWRVVPKVIAALISYAAERRIFRAFEDKPEYSSHADRRPLLTFTFSEERLTGMPVLGILYPSIVLAQACDPLKLASELDSSSIQIETILDLAESRVAALMNDLPVEWDTGAPVDEAWYWAAPILLDLHYAAEDATAWFMQEHLPLTWAGNDEEMRSSRWADHVDEARQLLVDTKLGRPPEDLTTVLAQMGLGGPAVCALRALARVASSDGVTNYVADIPIRNSAAKLAWGFRQLFNTPESTAIIRGINPEEPYWRRLLEYAISGCLQSVLDEYAHILKESLGLFDHSSQTIAAEVANEMFDAITLRTVNLGVDEIKVDEWHVRTDRHRMRAHLAQRFGDESAEYSDERTRADQVRTAFNSPFWPFILATTSVGQEGLDFHQYCHAVVHWNLPSNPVDLEQREGRVHRYKGHAVRKNVAQQHGWRAFSLSNGNGNPWQQLFEFAHAHHSEHYSDLVPYWLYPIENGARIERHVPAFPLSRDMQRLSELRQSLAVYRMVFGQPRQEELIEYLLKHVPEDRIDRLINDLRVDLAPPEKRSNYEE